MPIFKVFFAALMVLVRIFKPLVNISVGGVFFLLKSGVFGLFYAKKWRKIFKDANFGTVFLGVRKNLATLLELLNNRSPRVC